MIIHIKLNRTDEQQLEAHEDKSWKLLLEALRKKPEGTAGRATDPVLEIKSADDTTENSEAYSHVRRALDRNKNIDNSKIHLQVKGNLIILTGKVKSWIQKEEAGRVAATFNNFAVVNDIAISYF